MSKGEVERITDIGTVFNGNTEITSFDEFEQFTGVTSIGGAYNNGTFQGCTILREISLPPTLETIGQYAFYGCSGLTSVEGLSQVKSIGYNAFGECTALVIDEIEFPNLTSLDLAFKNVTLKKLNIPKVESNLGTGMFENSALTQIYAPLVPAISGDRAFNNCASLESVSLPRVISFPYATFSGCTALSELNIDWGNIEAIDSNAFYNCTSLSFDELNLPNLTSLGQNAFYGVKIKKLNLGALTTLPAANINTQNYGDKSVLEEIVLSDDLTTIGAYSFYGYSKLTKVNFPTSLTTILDNAFICPSLVVDVSTLPKSITQLGISPFNGATTKGILDLPNLTGSVIWGNYTYFETKLLDGIESLGNVSVIGGFMRQEKMKYAKIPATCTKIENNAFAGCYAMEYLICYANTPPTLTNAAFGTTENYPIYVPATMHTYTETAEDGSTTEVQDRPINRYKTATNWSTYADRLVPIEDHEDGGYVKFADSAVEAICVANWDTNDSGYMSKNECAAVTNIGTLLGNNENIITLHELKYFTGITNLVDKAFSGNVNMEEITIPSSVTTMGFKVFTDVDCRSLHTIVILNAESVITALHNTLTGLSAIQNIYVPDNLVSAYKEADNWVNYAAYIKPLSEYTE